MNRGMDIDGTDRVSVVGYWSIGPVVLRGKGMKPRRNGLKDCPADEFGYLGNYGVSEGGTAVQSVGKPIRYSGQFGCSGSPVATPKSRPKPALQVLPLAFTLRGFPLFRSGVIGQIISPIPASDFVGVGNDPDALASVRSAQGFRRYVFPACIVPESGQVPENSAKPLAWPFSRATKQVCDVLHDDEGRSYVASKSDDLGPQPRPLPADAGFPTSEREVLAWEAPGDDIDGNSIGSKSFAGKLADIPVAGDIGPVLGEDAAGELFDFTERDGFEATSSLQSKGKTTDAAEQVEHPQLARIWKHLVSKSFTELDEVGVHSGPPREDLFSKGPQVSYCDEIDCDDEAPAHSSGSWWKGLAVQPCGGENDQHHEADNGEEGLSAGHAAACERGTRASFGGKSSAWMRWPFGPDSSRSAACRHSGMKFAAFQLSIVVSGKPVLRDTAAEPPSASMISDAVLIAYSYDKRS